MGESVAYYATRRITNFIFVLRKRSKGSVASKKRKLWEVFARYIKERDGWKCVTCGREGRGQQMNAGHYIAKAACGADYYFSEQNVHATCAYCNLALEGNRPAYREFIIRKYGEDVLKDLETNYHTPNPLFDYEAKIQEYQEKLSALQ